MPKQNSRENINIEQVNRLVNTAAMYQNQGNFFEAERVLNQAYQLSPSHPDVLHLLGILHLHSNRADTGLKLLEEAVKQFPKAATYHFNLGNARMITGDLNGAIKSFKSAIKRDPKMFEAHKNLGVVLSQKEEHKAAELAFRKALTLNPNDLECQMNHATSLMQIGKRKEALKEMEETIDGWDNPPSIAWRNMGTLFLGMDVNAKAENLFRKAVETKPDDADAWIGLGHSLANRGLSHDAIDAYNHAKKLGFKGKELNYTDRVVDYFIADALMEAGDYNQAKELYSDLTQSYPEDNQILLSASKADARLGDFENQENKLRKILKKAPNNATAFADLASIPGRQISENEIAHMEQFISDKHLDGEIKATLGFALGDAFRTKKNYDKAFHYFKIGNESKGFVFDQKAYENWITQLIETFSTEFFDNHAQWGLTSAVPVLIVGTPRSGTTLTEQILSSHRKVVGAGERGQVVVLASTPEQQMPRIDKRPNLISDLNIENVNQFASNYLSMMQGHIKDNEFMVTNKLPGNFLQLGVFSLLFPKAPIIHTRRDPRDSLLSIYFKNFKGSHSYAHNLEDLGFWYCQYERLMAHWEKVLPNPYIAIDYEETVADQEGVTHRLLDFLGLNWDENVMKFYEQKRQVKTASLWQVRQPVYKTSVQRWRAYEKHLKPLFKALEPCRTFDDM